MKLTKASVAEILPPASKFEVRVFDDDLPGFGVRVLSGGKRSWIIQFRIAGRSTTKTIGRVERMSAGTARDLAKRQLAQAELGIHPGEEKKTAHRKAAETFKSIVPVFLDAKKNKPLNNKKPVKARTFEQIELHLTEHWSDLDGLPIREITHENIDPILLKIGTTRGLYAANRARGTLHNFFVWAMKKGYADNNPVIRTDKQTAENSRDRVLTDAELIAIWNACKSDDYGDIVRLLILTAQRRDEIGAITRTEIDLPGRKWTIPSGRTKNGLSHEVPLADRAIAILKTAMARPGREDRSAIFGDGGAGRGFAGWSKAKAALDKRIAEQAVKGRHAAKKTDGKETKKEQEGWRLHDLRRTVATRMADLGVLPHVIEAVLNHISGHKAGVAGVYNRALYAAEKRQALDLWAAHIEALIAGKPTSNVIHLKA